MQKEKPETKICKHCMTEINYSAKVCPQCRKKQRPSGCLIAICIFIVLILLVSCLGSGGDKTVSSGKNAQESNQKNIVESTKKDSKDTEIIVKETTKETIAVVTTKKVNSNTTIGQKNALKSAKSYLTHSSFSYQGLIDQLEYEKYDHEDAVYAVENCGADWNEQALKSAKSYLTHSSFSYQGLIDQLEYEKYTGEQAIYGVNNCSADWNEQAAKSAKSYLAHSSFSRDSLIGQLEYEKFTHEQAIYGVEAVGY